jgi:hypothetical protein
MNSDESFDNSTYADQMYLAKRELASFIGAVTELLVQNRRGSPPMTGLTSLS